VDPAKAMVEVLEGDLLPFAPKRAALAAQGLGIEGEIEAVSREVLEEEVRGRWRRGWFSVALSQSGLSLCALEEKG